MPRTGHGQQKRACTVLYLLTTCLHTEHYHCNLVTHTNASTALYRTIRPARLRIVSKDERTTMPSEQMVNGPPSRGASLFPFAILPPLRGRTGTSTQAGIFPGEVHGDLAGFAVPPSLEPTRPDTTLASGNWEQKESRVLRDTDSTRRDPGRGGLVEEADVRIREFVHDKT